MTEANKKLMPDHTQGKRPAAFRCPEQCGHLLSAGVLVLGWGASLLPLPSLLLSLLLSSSFPSVPFKGFFADSAAP